MNNNEEFIQNIHRYIDGQISDIQLSQLNEKLSANPEARKVFSDLLNLDSAIAAITVDQVPDNNLAKEKYSMPSSGKRKSPVIWMLALTVCLLLFVSLLPTITNVDGKYFATVSGTAGVEDISQGKLIDNQHVQIKKGSLELVTTNGAKIAIEAPAEFWFESAQRLHMIYGRVAADVPVSAKGFTVVTPAGEAVDLGTKFGVDVPAKGDVEVHVFQGEVIASTLSNQKGRSLKDGEAFRLRSDKSISRTLRSSAFIQPGEVALLYAALEVGQQAKSEVAIEKLRKDPTLIAFLDFESDSLPEGIFRMGQGRWPGSRAPEFVNIGDHMKIDVGGDREWQQLTLATWVRLDRLGEPFQSLLHTDGWGQHNGQVHWMVTRNSTMRYALYGTKVGLQSKSVRTSGFPDSLKPVLAQQGRWVHLAVVYNSVDGNVQFYFNGKLDSQERLKVSHPARLGPAQIGNWNSEDRKLSGRMDELLILGRTMSAKEIQNLFEAGNPYR